MSSRQSTKQSQRKSSPTATQVPSTINGSSSTNTLNGSGTVDSRRLKKRELDRKCQRMARERTKQRIAYLEQLVDNFRKEDANSQIVNLMEQLTNVQKERDDLAKTLKSIANSIRSHEILNIDRGDPKGKLNPFHTITKQPTTSITDMTPLSINELVDDSTSSPDFNPDINEHVSSEEDFEGDLLSPEVIEKDPVYPKLEHGGCDCCPKSHVPNQPVNLWRYACEALAERPSLSADIMTIEDMYAEDIPIRAILHGWNSVENFYGTIPPIWRKLRKIDEIVWKGMGDKERLSCLRVIHLLYSYHALPTMKRKRKIPQWYLRRPSQTMAHSYAIDYFAWPGVRERFVFTQHRYCSNIFWYFFNTGLHILWPYEFRDCYSRNATTGQYSISTSFEKRIFDINAWTMSDGMFKKWPEFSSDFPAYNRFPMHVSTTGLFRSNQNLIKALPEPEQQTETIEVIPETVPDEDTMSIGFNTYGIDTNELSNSLFSMQTFDNWYTTPISFQQQMMNDASQYSNTQNQHNVTKEMTFQALVSTVDNIHGMYGLSF